MHLHRRDFIKGCCGGAAALGAGRSLAWFDPAATTGKGGLQHDVLVYVFLRGGIDGLHLVVPYSGPDRTAYEAKRGGMAIPTDRLRPIAGTPWAWHPRAGGGTGDVVTTPAKWMQKLYDDNRLAIIHAAGMPTAVTRSHFDAQAFIEFGTPGDKSGVSGWITRMLSEDPSRPSPFLSNAFGFGSTLPTTLFGQNDAVSLAGGSDFRVDGFHWSWNDSNGDIAGHFGAHMRILPMWTGDDPLAQAGRAAADALEYMREVDFELRTQDNPDGYLPGGGAQYPNNGFGEQLRNVAQLIKLDFGLTVATLDYGFWDTHEYQGMPYPGDADHYDPFGNLTEGMASALDAFYTDLQAAGIMDRVTVVLQSEFGRRFRPNDSSGTDHGFGNVMFALGNQVNGGMHGVFPGLDDNSLFEGQDVDVTTDFRQVLAEVMVKRMGVPANRIGAVFPEFSYDAGATNVFRS